MSKFAKFWCAVYAMAVGGVQAAEPFEGKKVSGIELQHISQTMSPGKDFYEYVNEGWLKSTQIPADRSNYGSFSALEDDTKAAIRTLVEAAAADTNAALGSDAQKVGDSPSGNFFESSPFRSFYVKSMLFFFTFSSAEINLQSHGITELGIIKRFQNK